MKAIAIYTYMSNGKFVHRETLTAPAKYNAELQRRWIHQEAHSKAVALSYDNGEPITYTLREPPRPSITGINDFGG